MSEITIEVEDDPVPIVRIFAARFRRTSKNPAFVEALRGIDKPFAIASKKDPQALTIDVRGDRLHLTRGVSKDAAIVIRMDFDDGDDTPDVQGLWRHPLLAMRVGKLMEQPRPAWQDLAGEFWTRWRDRPRMPAGIALHDTDSGEELLLGDAPEVELYASGDTLGEILGGETVLLQAFMQRKVKGLCGLEHAAILSEITKDMMLDNE